MYKKTQMILLVMLTVGIVKLSAQEVISSAGHQINNSSTKVNFTVGETVINELHLDGNTILSGYHQPTLKVDTTINISETQNWNVDVYPNPTHNFLNVSWDNSIVSNMSYKLMSIDGRLILQGRGEQFMKIDVTDIASGNYYLFIENKEKSQTFKIQKIQ